MDLQNILNTIIGLGCGIFGWLLKTIWEAVKDLQVADKDLAGKLSSIEILVAGEYIRKDEFRTLGEAIFKKLDKIEDKLDCKMDK